MPALLGQIDIDEVVREPLSRKVAGHRHSPIGTSLSFKDFSCKYLSGVRAARTHQKLEGTTLLQSEDSSVMLGIDGCSASSERDAWRSALKTYLDTGSPSFNELSDSFAGFLFDSNRKKLLLFTDPLGRIPLFYTEQTELFAFATFAPYLMEICSPKSLHQDKVALATLLVYEHLFGERTLISEIKRVTPGTVLSFEFQESSIQTSKNRYWSFAQLEKNVDCSLEEAADKSYELMTQGLIQPAGMSEAPCVFLTGGLDSRTIAGSLTDAQISFESFTYGISTCRDIHLAKMIADELNVPHKAFCLEPATWLFDQADSFITATFGAVNLIHSHGMSVYPLLSGDYDLHFSGVAGGSFAGLDSIPGTFLDQISFEGILDEAIHHYANRLGLGLGYGKGLKQAFLEEADGLRELTRQEMQEYLQRFTDIPLSFFPDLLTLEIRYAPFFTLTRSLERQYYEVVCPYLHLDSFKHTASLPNDLRFGRILQKEVLDRKLPSLTTIPNQIDLSRPSNKNSSSFDEKEFSHMTEPGRDYPQWFRQHGRQWMTETIECCKFPFLRTAAQQFFSELDEVSDLSYPDRRKHIGKLSLLLTTARFYNIFDDKLARTGDDSFL